MILSENWAFFRWGFNFLACFSGLLMTRPGRWPHSLIVRLCVFSTTFGQAALALYLLSKAYSYLFILDSACPTAMKSFFITYFESSKIKKLHFQGIVPRISQPFWLSHSFCTYLYPFLCLFHIKIIVKYLICAGS